MRWRDGEALNDRVARRAGGERGSSVVMFVVALPLLLVFLFAVVDLGRTVFLHMALDDAAHAACRAACGYSVGEESRAELERSALSASPGLKGEALRLDVSANYGQPEEVPYSHRWYDENAEEFVTRPSVAVRRAVEVECVLRGAYLTPLGAVLSGESAGGSSFVFKARAQGVCDETVGGGSH